jgi:hypothetical protein
MELLKSREPLRFKHKDVTFLIKPIATVGDRLEIQLIGELIGDKIRFDKAEFSKVMIRNFVIGWEGVTEDGEPVPWSVDTFMTRFPDQDTGSELLDFIRQNTDIFRKAVELKKESRGQSNGHAR